jgi:hypothetical protein
MLRACTEGSRQLILCLVRPEARGVTSLFILPTESLESRVRAHDGCVQHRTYPLLGRMACRRTGAGPSSGFYSLAEQQPFERILELLIFAPVIDRSYSSRFWSSRVGHARRRAFR